VTEAIHHWIGHSAARRSIDRTQAAWPNARPVHLPIHASWRNQIEVVFSVIQRKVVQPGDLA
jgi:hypothetical protein